jgi:DNA polymerase III delta prime subunit
VPIEVHNVIWQFVSARLRNSLFQFGQRRRVAKVHGYLARRQGVKSIEQGSDAVTRVDESDIAGSADD